MSSHCPSVYPTVCLLTFRVRSISLSFIDSSFLKFAQIFAMPRQCAELINQVYPMKVKVRFQGQSSKGNISCPLYNFKTVRDFFLKVCTNIRMIRRCAAKKNCNPNFTFDVIMPLCLLQVIFRVLSDLWAWWAKLAY